MNPFFANARAVEPTSEAMPWDLQWSRFLPMWRVSVCLMSFFLVFSGNLFVRVNVVQIHKEIDHITQMQGRADLHQTRLTLELDARGRTAAIKQVADRLNLGAAPVVAMGSSR